MNDRDFVLFGLPHCAAIAATAAAAVLMVRLNRSSTAAPQLKRAANLTLAGILIVSVFCDPLWNWLSYRGDPEYALQMIREKSLPLHLCDVAALLTGWTLVRPRQRCAELGYLWGLAGTMQGVLTPSLQRGWESPEYWTFFAQHGGVQVAALALVFGAGLRPQPGALRRAMYWSWAYMAVISLCNWLLGTNYGFFNAPPEVPSLIDYMGPWPWYLLTLQAVAVLFFFLLLLPFRKPGPPQSPHSG
jgi:hypothetical integral membrane protein (TIGR02206 family)